MSTKILLIASVLSAFLLLLAVGVFPSGTSELLEQAQTYQQEGNYEQAELIYLQIVSNYPGSDFAFQAQKNLAILYVLWGRQPEADAAFEQLAADFYEHTGITEAIWQVAKEYEQTKKYDKAIELHQYNVRQFAPDKHAMWSQVEIIYSLIDSGDAAADAACDKLITVFSEQETLPKEIHQVAMRYSELKRKDKALELYQYNAEHFPKDMYAMWSQVEIVYSLIDSGDAAADAACDKLITVFSKQETLPKEIHQVAMKYSGSGQSEKAYALHHYNVEHFPDYKGLDVIWSQSELIRLDIQAGFYELACAGAKDLLAWPPDQNDLPREIHVTAKRFAEAGKHEKACELYSYNIEHFPRDMYAMWSQVEITYAHINGGDFAAADEACAQLLSLFSNQPTLPKEVYQVSEAYSKANRSDKAVELYRYIVERWPSSDQALLAQRDLTIRSIDADDEFAAQAAVYKLLSDFSKHKGISQVIHAVAQHYERAKGELEKAIELHRYNVEHFSSDIYAMWSQVEIVYSHIRDGNETGADEAFVKLVTVFAEQPTLPKEIYQVGDEYARALNYDKAGALYQHVITDWPDTEYEMWARTGIIKLDISLGNDANVQPALDELIADFNDQPDLPEAVFVIGEQYYRWASQCRKAGLAAKAEEILQKAIAVWQRIITDLSTSHITPQAYYMSARCYEKIGQYENAIEYYNIVVDNWPDYQYAWNAQFLIARCFDKLVRSGVITKEDAAPIIRQACENVITNYPDSMAVNAATNLMKRWESVKAR